MTKFQVIDSQTKEVRGTYSDKKRARRAVDRFDNAYGGYRHSVVELCNHGYELHADDRIVCRNCGRVAG